LLVASKDVLKRARADVAGPFVTAPDDENVEL
jgi:hypothetical protein